MKGATSSPLFKKRRVIFLEIKIFTSENAKQFADIVKDIARQTASIPDVPEGVNEAVFGCKRVNGVLTYGWYQASLVQVKPFSYYATHLDELGPILNQHYVGAIDLSKIWKVGDVMENIPLSSIAASSLGGDAQSAQNIDLVILDFNHDDKTDGSGKAAVTLGQKDLLLASGNFYSSYDVRDYAKYFDSARKTWLNSNYKSALPSELQSLIKSVNKVTGYPTNSDNSQTTKTTSEDCWLPSNWEVFGSNYSSYTSIADGTQYPYYASQSNRIKKIGKTGSNTAWWTRSGYWINLFVGKGARFVLCDSDGLQSGAFAESRDGLAPCFCL